jgi:hypothetical protein
VRFPPGALGLRTGNIPWSTPGDDPVWTPDGRGFLFSTTIVGEGPPSITGIWRVGAGGGLARMTIGTAAGVRRPPLPAGSPLAQATRFLLSPDRTLLATDPRQRLWVGKPDGRAGRFLPVHMPRYCVLAQYTWLSDGSGLAYVQLCPPAPNASAPISKSQAGQHVNVQSTLFSVRLDGSPPRQLYRAISADQEVIDLAPATQCVLCGY